MAAEDIHLTNEHIERCSTSQVIRERRIKTLHSRVWLLFQTKKGKKNRLRQVLEKMWKKWKFVDHGTNVNGAAVIQNRIRVHQNINSSLIAQFVKNLPTRRETWVQSLGWEDPLEKEKATHSSILAWRIPWTIQSMGSQRIGHDWATFTFKTLKIKSHSKDFSTMWMGCTKP